MNLPYRPYMAGLPATYEGVTSGGFQTTKTQEKLDELNTRFPNLSEAVRRTEIIAPSIETNLYDEGWMSSSYQC